MFLAFAVTYFLYVVFNIGYSQGYPCIYPRLYDRVESISRFKTNAISNVAYYTNNWKNLNNLVSSRYSNKIMICLISLKMICIILYMAFLQLINKSVRKIDNKTYEVSYVIEGRLYKMIVSPKRGPPPIRHVFDENDNFITDKIIPYIGPHHDWHGVTLTPKFFQCKSLTFHTNKGTEHSYEDIIPTIKQIENEFQVHIQ